jgi:hypothetical protein
MPKAKPAQAIFSRDYRALWTAEIKENVALRRRQNWLEARISQLELENGCMRSRLIGLGTNHDSQMMEVTHG